LLRPDINGDKPRSGVRGVFFQKKPRSLDRGEPRLTQSRLSAVVEDDIGRAVLSLVSRDSTNCTRCDFFRRNRNPVSREDVPLNRREAERPRDAEDDGPARSVGCAKVSDRSAKRVFEDGVATGKFFADARSRLPS
jgi:hypothetical protein